MTKNRVRHVPLIYRKISQKFEERAVSGRLPFSEARFILGSHFRISHEESFPVIKEMHSLGLVKVCPHRWVSLRKEPKL